MCLRSNSEDPILLQCFELNFGTLIDPYSPLGVVARWRGSQLRKRLMRCLVEADGAYWRCDTLLLILRSAPKEIGEPLLASSVSDLCTRCSKLSGDGAYVSAVSVERIAETVGGRFAARA